MAVTLTGAQLNTILSLIPPVGIIFVPNAITATNVDKAQVFWQGIGTASFVFTGTLPTVSQITAAYPQSMSVTDFTLV